LEKWQGPALIACYVAAMALAARTH